MEACGGKGDPKKTSFVSFKGDLIKYFYNGGN